MLTQMPHAISLEEAIALTTRYRTNRPTTAKTALSETFDKASVVAMLSASNSAKMRIYLGEKENGEICSVLVAADESGNDILPPVSSSRDGDDDILILEDAIRCPQLCPPESPLNN